MGKELTLEKLIHYIAATESNNKIAVSEEQVREVFWRFAWLTRSCKPKEMSKIEAELYELYKD